MAITTKSSQIQTISYVTKSYEFVDVFNYNASLLDYILANQTTGILSAGDVVVTFNGTPTTLTSNFNTGLGTGSHNAFIDLNNWVAYFSSIRTELTLTALTSAIELTTNVGYLYLNSNGTVEIVSAPYTEYSPDRIRILRFEKNSGNLYSIIIMPELAGTPRFVRTLTIHQPMMLVADFSVVPDVLALNRISTKCITEGAGCYTTTDINILNMSDAEPVKLVNDGSDVEYTNFVTSADSWLTATDYILDDFVNDSGSTYRCIEDHTSGTFATDLAAGKWILVAFRTAQLHLAYDGKLVVNNSINTYTSLDEAIAELPYEQYPAVNGDVTGEYAPVLRIAYKANATDLEDASEVYLLDISKTVLLQRMPIWYSK